MRFQGWPWPSLERKPVANRAVAIGTRGSVLAGTFRGPLAGAGKRARPTKPRARAAPAPLTPMLRGIMGPLVASRWMGRRGLGGPGSQRPEGPRRYGRPIGPAPP